MRRRPSGPTSPKEPLGNFLQGIEEASHRDVNQTLLGHSYGSLVAGQTMSTHMDLPVGNAIKVGSPGVGVEHAKDPNVPADHVLAAAAKNDLINLARRRQAPGPPQSECAHGAFRRPLDRSRNRPGL
ncbi:alpha/beta hydrolase [Streptomyces sp. NPDC015032]|uniref:alpha/beta hydrolase n=1 Tax=Streptomyces sp. NPDC015032 TaxID=3364937 RepID=UPI0036FC9D90